MAMATTLFHWTLHPWAIYAVVGLAIAYSTFRRGRPQLISSAFIPLFGRQRTEGPSGKRHRHPGHLRHAVRLGRLARARRPADRRPASQAGGLPARRHEPTGDDHRGADGGFICSAVSGVAKGIQWLSNINMVLAVVLALVVFVAARPMLILNLLPTAIGDYFTNLGQMAARTAATGGDETATWLAGWTVFYWAWWISWTPFVGMFIARISRGRTIRQFVAGVILIPSAVSLLWFAIFGGAAIHAAAHRYRPRRPARRGPAVRAAATRCRSAALLGVLAMVLVAIFFVSGADAASIVMGTLSQRGTIHPAPGGGSSGAARARSRIMLLVARGDALSGIQNITIIMAAPFALRHGAAVVALARDLRNDPLVRRGPAVDRGHRAGGRVRHAEHGDKFFFTVKPHKPEVPEQKSMKSPGGRSELLRMTGQCLQHDLAGQPAARRSRSARRPPAPARRSR